MVNVARVPYNFLSWIMWVMLLDHDLGGGGKDEDEEEVNIWMTLNEHLTCNHSLLIK